MKHTSGASLELNDRTLDANAEIAVSLAGQFSHVVWDLFLEVKPPPPDALGI